MTTSKCPSCGAILYSELEKGAHRCPQTDETPDVLAAEKESALLRAQRALLQPTRANLTRDAASVAQQVHDCWDGEVEVFVLLAARGTSEAARASTFKNWENLRAILKAVLQKMPEANLKDRLT